ncbi:hypothetical protein SMKI_04G6220 [Saccharomyces mikatae IFO 1815]|uniref:BZIP domain-containing protein n=1 Tax=Saccharomyces mikatae IFO 1815 TaxID=226126 RepID=A0AA35NHJ3_SACMI|nr:uncharacterized protein SMKI_04G6220 [Saccharomyces mikatae IFO 1815]CAI4038280.1 hypothetical protein SMKI_04G6220 [Saccharomyces mikatae IFO 1815]
MSEQVLANKDGIPKRKVGRPGRKRVDSEAKNRRTAQNRAAQRAFRDRKEARLKSLLERIELLEQKDAQNKSVIDFLQSSLKSLLSEVTKYRAKNVNDERILAFLDDLQEQQEREKDEEPQKREYTEKEASTKINETTETLPSFRVIRNTTVNTDTEVETHLHSSRNSTWDVGLCSTPRLTNTWNFPSENRTDPSAISDKSANDSKKLDFSLDVTFNDKLTGINHLDYDIRSHLSEHFGDFSSDKVEPLAFPSETDNMYFLDEANDDILLSSVVSPAKENECNGKCNGKCAEDTPLLNKEIKCELITKRLLNQESLDSIVPASAPYRENIGIRSEAIRRISSAISNQNTSCCHILKEISSLPKYSSLDIDNLCCELMTKAEFTDDCEIVVRAHDLQTTLVKQLL